MMLNTKKPGSLFTATTGSGYVLSAKDRNSVYRTYSSLNQELIDPVTLIAARSGVAAATITAQLLAWQIKVRQ